MLSIVRLIRFFWFLTVLVYFVVVFLCYFQWSDPVAVHFNELNEPIIHVGKSALFYSVTVFMLSINIIFVLLNTSIDKLPTEKLPIAKKQYWLSTKTTAAYAKYILKNWIHTLAALLNIVFILWIVMITYANLEQYDMRKPLSTFKYLTPFFFGSLTLLIIYLLIRYSIKKLYFIDNKAID